MVSLPDIETGQLSGQGPQLEVLPPLEALPEPEEALGYVGIVEEISAIGLDSYYVTLLLCVTYHISYILLCIHLHLMGSHGQHADMVVCFLWALNFQAKQALQIDPLKRTDSIIDGVTAQKGNAYLFCQHDLDIFRYPC